MLEAATLAVDFDTGVYTFTKDILITKDITLEGAFPDDVFIFQCTTDVAR
jgi:hypothetical protein